MAKTFLTAEWRKLILVNYGIDKALLQPFVPNKTELDIWHDTCYVSLVGFRFLDTKIKGIPIPFHTAFEEVNLRFYVRYKDHDGWKRGAVFIKEIVPKPAITWVANTLYKEKYETLPMAYSWENMPGEQRVEYKWKRDQVWNTMQVNTRLQLTDIAEGSEEEFITEHYWGYTRVSEHKTAEYGVEHPRWQVYETLDYALNVDFKSNYGLPFEFLKAETPKSVFLAEGSAIRVMDGRSI